MRDPAELAPYLPVVLLGAGALAAELVAGAAELASSAASSPDGDRRTPIPSGVWVWPLPSWQGYAPTITDTFLSWRTDAAGNRVRHNGVDIMYARRDASDQVDTYPPGTPAGSPRSFMPLAIPVLAVRDATVWSADRSKRGFEVVLDHGPPWASYYQHLDQMFLIPTQRGASKQRVRAGDVIGHVGADPTDREGLRHLHFELWLGGAHNAAVDPCPLMKSWYVLPSARPSAKPIV